MQPQHLRDVLRHFRWVVVAHALLTMGALWQSAWAAEASPEPVSTLVVALDDNYPPYVFRDSTGKLTGYLVDVWKLWEKKTGVQVNLRASDWEMAKARMQSHEATVIDTIFQTPERDKVMDFTLPYAQIPVFIYAASSIGGITDLEHLNGFLVGAKAGDACVDNLKKGGVAAVKTYSNYETLVQAAIAGQVRIFCLDEPPANYMLYKNHAEDLFNKAFQLDEGAFHRAVHKGDKATLALLNRGFEAISQREYQMLRDKWMGTRLLNTTQLQYISYGALASLICGAGLLLWGATLRRKVKQRTSDLDAERMRLHVLLTAIPDLVWMKDISGVYRFCNPVFERFFGAKEAAIVGKTDYDFVNKDLADSFRAHDQKAIAAAKPSVNEEWITFADDGHRALLETTKTPIRDASGRTIGVLGVARDITARYASEEQIRHLAFYDPLTTLPNRRLLADRLQQALAASTRNGKQGALLFIDLDHFKTLNDTHGHEGGDIILKEAANRISNCVREGDTVARLGGDEFVVMLENLAEESMEAANQAEWVGEKILRTLNEPYQLLSESYTSSASMGITLFDAHGNSSEDLMKHADMAMYQAKSAGRNQWRFFEPRMQAEVTSRAALEADLREGLKRQQFLLHYQAQIAEHHNITGAECLIRWLEPKRGLVPPLDFIALAESSGLILSIGKWVLETACAQLRLWEEIPEMCELTLAVNVSAKQFHQSDFEQQVMQVVQRSGIKPQRLKLELTESLLISDVEGTIAKMHALKAHGIQFSLDDFGTGYSSLSYLKRLPLDQLKIDQSFVRDLLVDENDVSIAATIVALANTLGIDVIAEGVETSAHRDKLAELGCFSYQGYFFRETLHNSP
jgi:diguanylate cyclase (GGDEF)-like protein/PAS domain S-box-containing protein